MPSEVDPFSMRWCKKGHCRTAAAGRPAAECVGPRHATNSFAVNISCSLPTRLPKRLLLAEDDVDLRALLSMTLRREGYEVIEVGCGEALVASLLGSGEKGLGIDVVLTDVRMPNRSGLEALAWMRSSMLRIPTIVISAFCDHAVHVKARGLGALAVLEKPVELGKLRTVLRTYFERKESAC